MKNGQFIVRGSKYIKKTVQDQTQKHSPNIEASLHKLRLFHFYNSAKNENTNASRYVMEEMNKHLNLSYINNITQPTTQEIIPGNVSDLINKKYEIKQVEQTKETKRIGLIGYKVGMTGTWDKFGTWFPLTVVKIDRCQVTQVKTEDKDRYYAVQLGVGEAKPDEITKPMLGHFVKHKIPPKKDIQEFRVTPDCLLPVGYMLSVRHFVPGQLVDVFGTSKGKGWQGVMKRWNFAGGFATHGNSKKHRSAGSIGNREKPGRVFKGKKMAGHDGNSKVTVKHLLVYKIDHARNLIYLKGSIPGNTYGLVTLFDSIRIHEKQYKKLPYPTFIQEEGKEYPAIVEFTDTQDLNEKYDHDNDEVLGVSEEEEEGPAEPSEEGMDEMEGAGAAAGGAKK
jgi:large subunit ribosomal protein L3